MNERSVRVPAMVRLPVGVVLCAACAATSCAQGVPAGGWQSVQALPSQTRVRIAADAETQTCFVDSVTEERIACSSGPSHAGAHHEFAREQVKSVRLTGHFNPMAAVVTAAAFTAVGAGMGATQTRGLSSSGKAIGVGALSGFSTGVVVGWIVGRSTGGLHGALVYRRP